MRELLSNRSGKATAKIIERKNFCARATCVTRSKSSRPTQWMGGSSSAYVYSMCSLLFLRVFGTWSKNREGVKLPLTDFERAAAAAVAEGGSRRFFPPPLPLRLQLLTKAIHKHTRGARGAEFLLPGNRAKDDGGGRSIPSKPARKEAGKERERRRKKRHFW